MSNTINDYLSQNKIDDAIEECSKLNQKFLGFVLSKIYNSDKVKYFETMKLSTVKDIKVKLLCNWCSSEELAKSWNKMCKDNFSWNNIIIVWNENPDYYVVINKPPDHEIIDNKKTIVFQMEPFMASNKSLWGIWAEPDESEFLKVLKHENSYNNLEWHLSLNYNILSNCMVLKKPEYDKVISTVLSDKYRDIGQMKRIDFVKYLETKDLSIHVYGNNKWDYKEYKGPLPWTQKDNAILPYKYIFNAENNPIPNYCTEKLIDGILGECLTFYWGCPNVREIIDPRCYVQLELSDFENDYEVIKKAIAEDWYSQRLPFIKKEKSRILNELQFFPRLEKIILENQSKT